MSFSFKCSAPKCTDKKMWDVKAGNFSNFCTRHQPIAPPKAALPLGKIEWLKLWDRYGMSANGLKEKHISDVNEITSEVLDGVTWQDLIISVQTDTKLDITVTGLDTKDPVKGMSFRIGECNSSQGMSFQVTSSAQVDSGAKAKSEPCHEAKVFSTLLPLVKGIDTTVLIHQSHAPCSGCCKSFAGWALDRKTAIVVGFELGDGSKGSPDGKAGTYFFLPDKSKTGNDAEALYYYKVAYSAASVDSAAQVHQQISTTSSSATGSVAASAAKGS